MLWPKVCTIAFTYFFLISSMSCFCLKFKLQPHKGILVYLNWILVEQIHTYTLCCTIIIIRMLVTIDINVGYPEATVDQHKPSQTNTSCCDTQLNCMTHRWYQQISHSILTNSVQSKGNTWSSWYLLRCNIFPICCNVAFTFNILKKST